MLWVAYPNLTTADARSFAEWYAARTGVSTALVMVGLDAHGDPVTADHVRPDEIPTPPPPTQAQSKAYSLSVPPYVALADAARAVLSATDATSWQTARNSLEIALMALPSSAPQR